jgi:hypothetical protein
MAPVHGICGASLKALVGSTNRNEGPVGHDAVSAGLWRRGQVLQAQGAGCLILCVVAALVSAYGIFQYYGLDFLHLNPEEIKDV